MAHHKKIKVGYCVAYDWYLLKHSLPTIYQQADTICLSIDKNYKSWTGNNFEFDNIQFQNFIKSIDVDSKIHLYYDDFSLPHLSPMQNEVRQRNMIAQFLKNNDEAWYVQLDADEYFLNFEAFCNELHRIKTKRNINVCCPFLILFKQTEKGFLYIKNMSFDKQEMIPVATNNPDYKYGRKNGFFNYITNNAVLHQSWARSELEIKQKLSNWGHHKDFDLNKYFEFWNNIHQSNYKSYTHFHPFTPTDWEAFDFLEAESIDQIIEKYKNVTFFKLNPFYKKLKNSIWYSRFNALIKKLISG